MHNVYTKFILCTHGDGWWDASRVHRKSAQNVLTKKLSVFARFVSFCPLFYKLFIFFFPKRVVMKKNYINSL